VKVSETVKKILKPKREAMIEMKKMTRRNFGNLMTTEAYKNVLRDNENAERLKALLRQD
jgi:hypothetical protein